ncbi:hypothetical protein [Sulfurimonas sp.]|uniref:hypothetical protein n=1 Tax=Sulfurimonas sp. TaxID=2022749 RepID=UPI003D12A063
MNIYLVDRGFRDMDAYDSFVCIAENEEDARNMHPNNCWAECYLYQDWCTKEECKDLQVTLLGVSIENEARVVLASYNNS